MIKPGYSLVVVAPPRGTLTNQGLVAPLTPTATPIYLFYSPSSLHSRRREDGNPPYNLILNWTELNWTDHNRNPPPPLPPLYSLPQKGCIILHALIYLLLNLLFIN